MPKPYIFVISIKILAPTHLGKKKIRFIFCKLLKLDRIQLQIKIQPIISFNISRC